MSGRKAGLGSDMVPPLSMVAYTATHVQRSHLHSSQIHARTAWPVHDLSILPPPWLAPPAIHILHVIMYRPVNAPVLSPTTASQEQGGLAGTCHCLCQSNAPPAGSTTVCAMAAFWLM